MADTPAADEAGTDLVLNVGSFTGPERREVQQRFDHMWGDLLAYTWAAVIRGPVAGEPLPPLVDGRDGARYFPDEILQHMLWVQERRTDPDAKLEDFDGLSLVELANARARGIPPKASEPEPSPRSSPASGSARRSPASRGKQPTA